MFKLAWRNIWRQKRRTSLLLIVVAYATMTMIFMRGMVDGRDQSILSGQARFLQAPVLITTTAYHADPDPDNALKNLDFLSSIQTTDGVLALAPRLDLPGLLRSPYSSEIIFAKGVDPVLEPRVSDIPSRVSEGRMLEKPGELVLGIKLAEKLDVRLGERLALEVASVAGPQATGLIVVGFIKAGMAAIDQRAVLIHLDDARALSGVSTATSIALDAARGQESQVAKRVQSSLPEDVQAYDLMTLLAGLGEQLEAGQILIVPILLIFAVFAALAVTSTLLVSVLERKREFGMIASVGLAPRKLARIIVIEAVLVTTLGWLIGLVLGYSITYLGSVFNVLGPIFSMVGDAFESFGLSSEVYTASRPEYILYAASTIIMATIFAILIPARRIARLNPVEAMRDE